MDPRSLLEEAEKIAQKKPEDDIDMDLFDKEGEERRRDEDQKFK